MKKSEKYIKEFLHNIHYQFSKMKTGMVNFHYACIDFSIYKKTGNQVGTILLNGFFIWVMLFPFVVHNPVWFIPSYGIIPWFVINFIQEIKQ